MCGKELLQYVLAGEKPPRIPILGYKTGLFFSPTFLHECGWFRRLTELVDCFHAHGVSVVFHSDGDIRPILKDLEATGIDGLNPIETAAGLTVGHVRPREDPTEFISVVNRTGGQMGGMRFSPPGRPAAPSPRDGREECGYWLKLASGLPVWFTAGTGPVGCQERVYRLIWD